jgi:hypothetical protein
VIVSVPSKHEFDLRTFIVYRRAQSDKVSSHVVGVEANRAWPFVSQVAHSLDCFVIDL